MLGGTHAAPNRAGHHKRFVAASRGAVGVDDVWFLLRVGFANRTAAKFTGRMSRSFAMPTFHNFLPSPATELKIAVRNCELLRSIAQRAFLGEGAVTPKTPNLYLQTDPQPVRTTPWHKAARLLGPGIGWL